MSRVTSVARAKTGGPLIRRSQLLRRLILPWLLLAPILVLNIVVVLGPSAGSVYFAFTNWSGLDDAEWVGLANFQRMLADPIFYRAFGNNLKYLLFFLTIPIVMGLLGAALLMPVRRLQLLFRTVFFLPYVLATVVTAQIWRNILHPTSGVGVWLADTYGWQWANVKFFGDQRIVLWTIAFIDNWHWWGFLVVVYLAAMQAIDPEYYEAARLEGATAWQQFRYVTLPSIRPTLVFTLLITTIGSMLVFDYVFILTQGGPAHASEVLATEVYSAAFDRFEVGYAAAIGLSMSFVCGVVVAGYVLLRRKGWEI